MIDHPRERRAGAATQAEKGKAMADAGTSSSVAGVMVMDQYGKPVKLNGPIDVTWSHDGRIRRARGKKLRLFVEKEVSATRQGYRSARIPLDEQAQIDMAMRNSLRDSFSTLEHDSCPPFGKSTGSASGAASCSTGKQSRLSSYYKNTQDISRGPFDIDLARSRTQVQPRIDVMLEKGHKEKLGIALAKWMTSSEPQVDATTELESQLKRKSSDIGWEWGRLVDPNDKNRVKCLLCGHESTGGIHRLHAMMREKIGGELVRWNATRFGTVFIFLHSFLDRKDKFKLWMASADWENSTALNPKALYTSKMARKPKFQHVVTMAIKKLSSSSSKASAAIDQYTFFRKQAGLFGGEEAKDSALNGRASAEELGGLNEEEMVLLNSRIGSGRKNGRKRNDVEEDIGDDFLSDSSEGGGSPTYNESGDSDSNDGGGDDEDGEPSGPCFAARTQPKLATDQYNGPGQDEQAVPLRPRSKRQKKLSIKGLYMLQKVNDLIFKHKHKNMAYTWTDSMARF
ncbi:hypothetical protein ZEAMMB73_Zm00001d008234 [Zea mays]|uniref:Uncharacterized protein n=1 Tax=Zea mays TaxID=4577 RepID=A0A1D6FB25_MAIZE|nr:hypothetical protein ZEAMMB73_Zm00001d008234 [Zea mays]